MKCILTVIGKDKPGIIYKVSEKLAFHNINIEDISQTIMQNMFTMIMLVNIAGSNIAFGDLYEELKKLGEEVGVKIHLQNEEVFNAMHKV